jgi:hypothetical protein
LTAERSEAVVLACYCGDSAVDVLVKNTRSSADLDNLVEAMTMFHVLKTYYPLVKPRREDTTADQNARKRLIDAIQACKVE